jgi:hypothetical protein
MFAPINRIARLRQVIRGRGVDIGDSRHVDHDTVCAAIADRGEQALGELARTRAIERAHDRHDQ